MARIYIDVHQNFRIVYASLAKGLVYPDYGVDSFRSFSPNKEDHLTKLVMAHDGVDVWKVDPNGQVDMRMNGQLLGIVQDYIPGCRLLISSVETHIQEAEAEMLSSEQKLDVWEQALLQEVQDQTVSWQGDVSCKSVAYNANYLFSLLTI